MVALFVFSLLLVFYASAPALAQFDQFNRPNFGVCNLQPFNPSIRTCGRRGISRAECLALRRCCYTVFPRPRCYERGIRSTGLGQFRPSPVPDVQLPGGFGSQAGFSFGGEPGYSGSSFVRRCDAFFQRRRCAGLPIGPYNPFTFPYSLNAYRSLCYRFGCCWNPRRRTCTLAQFFVTSLRNECPPGFEDPPACRETNECADDPCENGGECVDEINAFSCDCPIGIGGGNCDEVCGAPPSVDNAAVTTSGTLPLNVGETAIYECEDDFRLEGTATVVCQSDGTYSPDPPQCIQTCGPPPGSDEDGLTWTEDLAEYDNGDVVTYDCTSQTLSPEDAVNQCVQGSWLNPAPSCFSCGPPPLPTGEGGYIEPPNTDATQFDEDEVVTYRCYSGGTLIGDETNTCQGDGSWSNDPPDCSPSMCPPVDQGTDDISVILSDTSLDVDEPVPVGTIAEYTCNPEFVQLLPEEAQSTCTAFTNGPSWVPAVAPECLTGCRIPQGFADSGGTLQPTFPSGIYPPSIPLVVICPSGDTDPIGITTATCDGDFGDLETAVCASVVECGDPETFPAPSGITGPTGADTSPYVDGETQTYGCDDSLQSPDPSVSTCMDGDWSITLADPPTCSQTRCSPPVDVDDATVRFSNGDEAEDDAYEVNDLLTYVCNDGFFTTVSEADRTTRCDNNGGVFEFSLDITIDEEGTCEEGCSPPAEFDGLFLAFPNGEEARDPGYAENDALTYQCDPGFITTSPEADRTITCEENGGNFMFSAIGFDPTSECRPVCETNPDSLTNGDFTGASGPPYDEGDTIVYECSGDLVTIPTNGDGNVATFTNECTGPNTWSLSSGDDDFPMCVCIALPDVDNQDPAQMVGIGTEVGTSVLYLCEDGFLLVEPGTENECTGDPTYGWSLTDAGANLPSCLEDNPDINIAVLLASTSDVDFDRCSNVATTPVSVELDDANFPEYGASRTFASNLRSQWRSFEAGKSAFAVGTIGRNDGVQAQCLEIVPYGETSATADTNLANAPLQCSSSPVSASFQCIENTFGATASGVELNNGIAYIFVLSNIKPDNFGTELAISARASITAPGRVYVAFSEDGAVNAETMSLADTLIQLGETDGIILGNLLVDPNAEVIQDLIDHVVANPDFDP